MGGRGSRAGSAPGGGLGGGAFTVVTNANGTATIIPNNNANAAQNIVGAGSGISDTNTHTTYFTPADMAIVSGAYNTNGKRLSPRSGTMQTVGYYNTGDYYNINTELRDMADGRRRNLTPQTKAVVDAMDRNMRPLNNDLNTTRWTDMNAIRSNLGMSRNASMNDIVQRLKNGDVVNKKADYTSSTWDAKQSSVAGIGGRYVKIEMHYKKGASVQFSPTRKEHEVVGARGKDQRYANARIERQRVASTRGNSTMADILVVDCYVDN